MFTSTKFFHSNINHTTPVQSQFKTIATSFLLFVFADIIPQILCITKNQNNYAATASKRQSLNSIIFYTAPVFDRFRWKLFPIFPNQFKTIFQICIFTYPTPTDMQLTRRENCMKNKIGGTLIQPSTENLIPHNTHITSFPITSRIMSAHWEYYVAPRFKSLLTENIKLS